MAVLGSQYDEVLQIISLAIQSCPVEHFGDDALPEAKAVALALERAGYTIVKKS